MKTGVVNLPLHSGMAPRWLFQRMVKLSRAVSEIIIDEFGQDEFLRRISDPCFFQGFGCVIGFDWHSSGLSTTTCGALKTAGLQEFGIFIAGGKGKTSRKTPKEIERFGDEINLNSDKIKRLVYSSRMCAKVDSAVLQDSYELYHHCFLFSENGSWSVVQQGMNPGRRYARRYHWLSGNIQSFVEEPHNAICCDKKQERVLDMTARESEDARKISVDLVNDDYFPRSSVQRTIHDFTKEEIKKMNFPKTHHIADMDKRNIEMLKKAYEIQPKDYEELVAIKGIGAKTIRSLALVSDLIYGKPASWEDPVKYSFAHGGKDKIPYEISKEHYDKTTNILKSAIENMKAGDKDKLNALKRLNLHIGY